MRSTFVSALAYFVFISSSWFDAFLKKPKIPLGSSAAASKPFSSVTRPVTMSPISPRSLVRMFSSVALEKSATFFWLPAPYCKIWVELVRSIFCAKSSTIFSSCGLRLCSASSGFGMGFSSTFGSKVNVGAGAVSRVNSGIISFILVPSFPYLCLMVTVPAAGLSAAHPVRHRPLHAAHRPSPSLPIHPNR